MAGTFKFSKEESKKMREAFEKHSPEEIKPLAIAANILLILEIIENEMQEVIEPDYQI